MTRQRPSPTDELRIKLTPPQSRFWAATDRYLDFEGAVRSGKTTVALLKLLELGNRHAGLQMLAARWTQDSLDAQLKPRWREIAAQAGLRLMWHGKEQYDGWPNGTRLYLRALKAGDDQARYSKIAGLTLGVIYVDQAEEIPYDIYQQLQARISQVGVPQHLILTPNPPSEDHWLAQEFPEADTTPDHRYIRATLADNAAHLDATYLAQLAVAYPPGHVLYRRYIEGRRGLSVVGQPVYAHAFRRALHVAEVVLNPELPLIEAWDFGHRHPAVLWLQWVGGACHILGEVMGQDEFLETFAPRVLQARTMLGPRISEVWSCCDPAGAIRNPHGTAHTALDVLRAAGVSPRYTEGANSPVYRDGAIQRISQAMLREVAPGQRAFLAHPRCRVLIDGLEGGYVWDTRWDTRATHAWGTANIRRPKKDGQYDHLQNCLEYAWIDYGPAQLTTREWASRQAKDTAAALRRAQRDWDPDDRRAAARSRGRAGY